MPPKEYVFADIEPKWQAYWEDIGLFEARRDPNEGPSPGQNKKGNEKCRDGDADLDAAVKAKGIRRAVGPAPE